MSLELTILVPDGVALRSRVVGLRAADASGLFGVRSGHEALVTMLVPCVVWLREEGGGERFVAVDGGALVVDHDRVSITTREAVVADRLEEIADTLAGMLDANRQQEQAARAEFAGLQISLLRQLRKVEKST